MINKTLPPILMKIPLPIPTKILLIPTKTKMKISLLRTLIPSKTTPRSL